MQLHRSIIASGVFDWIFEAKADSVGIYKGLSLGSIVQQEFALYQWHLRERGGQSNLGRSRIMYFSGIQQIIIRNHLAKERDRTPVESRYCSSVVILGEPVRSTVRVSNHSNPLP